MTKHLSVVEKRVTNSDEYLKGVRDRSDVAIASSLHFWVFQHATDSSRFVEFVEGTDAVKVAQVAGVETNELWNSIKIG